VTEVRQHAAAGPAGRRRGGPCCGCGAGGSLPGRVVRRGLSGPAVGGTAFGAGRRTGLSGPGRGRGGPACGREWAFGHRAAGRGAAVAGRERGPSRLPRGWRRRCGSRGGCSGTPKSSGRPSGCGPSWSAAGPLEPLLADPSVTDVLVSAPDRVWVDRGGGLELTGRLLSGRGGRTTPRAAPGGRGRAPARRRTPLGRRPAARRHPSARGTATGRRRLDLPVAAGRTAAGVHARRAGGGGDGAAGRGPLLRALLDATAVLPDQRRHRQRQDDAAERPAGPRRAGRADRARRGLGGAAPRPSPRRTAGEQTRQPGGRRTRHAPGPGPPGPADAAGPAGRRRGARARSRRICSPP
jgi:hypothetical protein